MSLFSECQKCLEIGECSFVVRYLVSEGVMVSVSSKLVLLPEKPYSCPRRRLVIGWLCTGWWWLALAWLLMPLLNPWLSRRPNSGRCHSTCRLRSTWAMLGRTSTPFLGDLITSCLIFWLPILLIFYLCKVLLMFQGKMLRMRRPVFWKVVFDTPVCNVTNGLNCPFKDFPQNLPVLFQPRTLEIE